MSVRPNRQSGICPRFIELMHPNEDRTFTEVLQREREGKADGADVAAIRQKRDRVRRRNSRLCRKYGLKSRRDRQ